MRKKDIKEIIFYSLLWPLWISMVLFFDDKENWKYEKVTIYSIIGASLVIVLCLIYPILFILFIIIYLIWAILSLWTNNRYK